MSRFINIKVNLLTVGVIISLFTVLLPISSYAAVSGDLNGDGKVTAADALMALKHLRGDPALTASQAALADADGDGNISQVDADLILARAVSLVSRLPVLFGDVNDDGKVTAADALMTGKYAAGQMQLSTHQAYLADVNRDRKVTSADAQLILDRSVGNVKSLPITSGVLIPVPLPTPVPYSNPDIDTTAPVITITLPQKGMKVSPDGFVVSGSVSDKSSGVKSLTISVFDSGTGKWTLLYKSVAVDNTGSWEYAVPGSVITPGKLMYVWLIAKDNSGNEGKVNNNYSVNVYAPAPAPLPAPVPVPSPNVVMGDLNSDGKVTAADSLILFKSLVGGTLTDYQKTVGDVNNDGVINAFDGDGILAASVGLSFTNISGITRMYGDLNGDGKVTASDSLYVGYYVRNGVPILTPSQNKASDVDGDGNITLTDVDYILKAAVGSVTLPIPTSSPAPAPNPSAIMMGDINSDGKVTTADALLAIKHINQSRVLTAGERELADADGDGRITQSDVDAIIKRAVGSISQLPVMYGDLNNDGAVTTADAKLVLMNISGTLNLNYYQNYIADVNRDGAINKADSDLILNAAVGLITLPAI